MAMARGAILKSCVRTMHPCTAFVVSFLSSTTFNNNKFSAPLTFRTFSSSNVCRKIAEGKDDAVSNTKPPASFATDYHAPVMCSECIEALLGCQRKTESLVFVDGTLGGGGHSLALLERLGPNDVVFGCDVDQDALDTASQRLEPYLAPSEDKPLFVPLKSNFCDLAAVIPSIHHPVTKQPIAENGAVDGILLDLGVSSFQIDTADRGFAFMKDGPLDMRMGGAQQTGLLTAADVCNEFPEADLRRILKRYGDEPRAKAIAHSIVQHRPLSTTGQLVSAVAAVTPDYAKKKRMGRTASLARVFQSLRIVVNQEDVVLEKALTKMCPTLIRPGGRLVILSYHSMEDRATKRIMKHGSLTPPVIDEKDMYGNYIGTPRPWKTVGKGQKATEQEVERNSRSRSAMLRVAERQET